METKTTSNRIHPLVAMAAVSVTLVSLTGVAAITGLLPTSHGTASPTATLASTSAGEQIAIEKTPDEKTQAVIDKAEAVTENAKLIKPPQEAKTEKSVKPPVASKEERPVKPAPAPTRVAAAAPADPEPNYDFRDYGYSSTPDYTQRAPQAARATYCDNCGRIESVDAITQAAAPSGLGIAAGAVIGGLLGNQVGDGSGQKLATVAGAIGGGFAGNEVEKRTRSATSYQIRVRMEDGSVRTIPQSSTNGWQVGDRVKVVNGSLVSNG